MLQGRKTHGMYSGFNKRVFFNNSECLPAAGL